MGEQIHGQVIVTVRQMLIKSCANTGDSQGVVEHLSLFFFLSYRGGESREEKFTNASGLGVVG